MKVPFTKSITRFFLAALFLLSGAFASYAQVSNTPCNRFSPLVTATYSNLTVTSSTIFSVDQFSPKANLIDADTTNAATWNFLIGGSAYVEVKDNNATGAEVYPAGSYAGFVVDNNTLVSLLGSATITTYLGGVTRETIGSGSLLSLGISPSIGRVGFVSTLSFDRIRISFSGLSVIGSISVYYAEVQKYCAGAAPACNTNTALAEPAYPAAIDASHTGLTGITLGSITNESNVINSDTNDFATISLPVGVLATGSIAVKDQVTVYPAGYFAGFEVANPALLNLDLLNNSTITTYLNGVQQEIKFANGLVVSAPLLTGGNRQVIGFATTLPFDEVRYTINQVVGVNLGSTNVYNAIVKRFCPGPALVCNTITNMTEPAFPVFVDATNTGINGVACVGCSIANPENVIDTIPTNYAQITLTAGVINTGTLAVKDQLTTYPANTYAGFDVQNANLLNADVLGDLTITLLNNGAVVQTGTGSSELITANSSILTGSPRSIVGIVSTVPFDEVKITVANTVTLDLGTILIYNVILQKGCAGSLACNSSELLTTPGFPVVIEGTRTGINTVGCVACVIDNPINVITPITTDYARINLTAGALSTGSISVRDIVTTYPAGTTVGFVVRDPNNFLDVNLLNAITITTYLNGVQQQSKTGGQLLDLDAIIIALGSNFNVNAGFTTNLPWNEVRITYSNVLGALTYLDVYGAFVDTRSIPSGTPGFLCNSSNPDFNVTYKNVTVTGDVSTNDHILPGTTYGTAVIAPGVTNPSGDLPTVNPDGTYSFTPSQSGVYVFTVPVCNSGVCKDELLTITVLDSNSPTNPPVANTDIATTEYNTPVTLKSLANDAPGTIGSALVPGSVTIIDLNGARPGNTVRGGTATVNPANGDVTYTPAPGFVGTDTIRYSVCDNQLPPQCASAYQIITVLPSGSKNTTAAADDYVATPNGVPVNGNVKTNDTDPEGDAQTVATQNTTIPGKGTLVLNADGTFTFTPIAGFIGPVDFPYTTCDNGTPQACAGATLHVLVEAPKVVLAITLTNFTATGVDCGARLSWTTTNEVNFASYVVEVSANNQASFTTTSTVSPVNSTRDETYETSYAMESGVIYYYRLKMINNDGSFSYSPIRTLSCGGKAILTVAPNPVTDLVNISGMANGKNTVTIFNINGKIILQQIISGNSGAVNMLKFAAGTYLVKVVSQTGTTAASVIIKN